MNPAEPGSTDADTDAELLARHVAGDRDAFDRLVARHRDRLWAVALRTLGHREDAADAVQEALLSAHRGAAGFRGGAAVTTWLHRIVVNACYDVARRRTARPTVPLDERTAATVADPLDGISVRETAVTVVAALRRLPVEQAAAIVLVDIEGFPVADAAEVLDVPVGTVKSRCARGRAALVRSLAEPGRGNSEPSRHVQPLTVPPPPEVRRPEPPATQVEP